MKVIDLLNNIANGEEVPKKIKYLTTIYTLRSNLNYYEEDKDSTFKNGLYYQFIGGSRLNDEVEIIEEDKKIEKLKDINCEHCIDECYYEPLTKEEIALDISTLKKWINKLIDEVNKLKENKND